MRRFIFIAIWLALALPARAASLSLRDEPASANHTGSTVSTIQITLQQHLFGNELMILSASFYGGGSAPTGLTISGSTWTLVKNTTCGVDVQAIYQRNATLADSGSVQTLNWTNAAGVQVSVDSFIGSDGVVPVLHAAATPSCNASATTLIAPSITPAQSGDAVYLIGSNGASGAPTGTWSKTPVTSFAHTIQTTAWFGWSNAGVAPGTMPTYSSNGAAAPIITEALDIEASGAGAVIVAPGTENFTGSSVSAVVPGSPPFANINDIDFALVSQYGIGAVNPLFPPADIQPRFSIETDVGSGSSATAAISASTVAGDQMVAMVRAGHANSLSGCSTNGASCTACTSNSGGNAWTLVDHDNTQFLFNIIKRTASASDISSTLSCTFGGTSGLNIFLVGYYSVSGGFVTVPTASAITNAGSGTTFTMPTVASGGANRLIVPLVYDNGGTNPTLTFPAPVRTLLNNATQGGGGGDYPQAVSGTTLAPVVSTSGGSGLWEGIQLVLAAGGAPGWTQIGTDLIDPSNASQLDLFWHKVGTVEPSSWTFALTAAASSASGIIVAAGNLNTTTPTDSEGILALPGLDNPQFPSFTPSSADELALKFSTASNVAFPNLIGYPNSYIYTGPSSTIALGFSNVSIAGANPTASLQSFGKTTPFAAATIGLDAATAPAAPTAHARINQGAIMLFGTAAAPAGGGSSFLWTPGYHN